MRLFMEGVEGSYLSFHSHQLLLFRTGVIGKVLDCCLEIMLYIDLRPRQTCHSKDGGSAYSIGVGELGRQYGTGLKSHGTVIDWCTGREWPVNCMTVISAQWRSNRPFQRRRKWHIPMASYGEILSGRLNYYITREDRKSVSFGDQTSLEIGEFGDKMW